MIVNHCVHAYQSSYLNIAGDNAYHTVGMDSEVVDSDNFHDNTTNNSRLTFPSNGTYLVFANPMMANPGGTIVGRITVNGIWNGYELSSGGATAAPTGFGGPCLFWLNSFSAGDYVESQILNNAGGTQSAKTQMCALEVSDWSCAVAGLSDGTIPIAFPNTIYDPHGMVTSTTVLTAQKDGYYLCLFQQSGDAGVEFRKNGSGSALNGSGTTHSSAADYAVEWFAAGDTLTTGGAGGGNGYRLMAMVYLGDSDACLGYTYNSVNFANNDAGFITGVFRTDSEFLDPCAGHPRGGYQYNTTPFYCLTCGSFNMLEGYHFALAKMATDGGTFNQNDGVYTVLNGAQLGNVFSTNAHDDGATYPTEALAFSCFQAAFGDTFTGNWLASGLYVELAFTPVTNVFVTDTAEFPPGFTGQIYRRLEVPAS